MPLSRSIEHLLYRIFVSFGREPQGMFIILTEAGPP